jgi:uncharacterized membrane protein YfcA
MFVWTTSFIVAVVVNVILSALTMPAGIGGGILFVPILRIIAGMSHGTASALSQILITGASVGSVLFQVIWQYKHRDEPILVQPYYVLLMMPALLSGSVIGVFLHNWLPDVVSLIVLLALCVLSSVVIFRKGIQAYRKENFIRDEAKRRQLSSSTEGVATPSPPITSSPAVIERGSSLVSLECGFNIAPEPGLYIEAPIDDVTAFVIESPPQSFMYDETELVEDTRTRIVSQVSISSLRHRRQRTRPATPIAVDSQPSLKSSDGVILKFFTKTVNRFIIFVISYWAFLIFMTLIRGTRHNPSFAGVKPCGTVYWILSSLEVIVGIVFSFTICWSDFWLISGSLMTGIAATISGASGGILLNPMMLHRGLDPQQTAATSTVIMLVMASCSAIQFLLDDVIDPILASLMLTTFAGSVVGLTGVTWVVKKMGRQSFLIFLLGGIVVVGGAMLIYVGIRDVLDKKNSNPFALGQLC